jgi:hypothetical protein
MKIRHVLGSVAVGLLLASAASLAQDSQKPAASKAAASQTGKASGGVEVLKIAICRDIKDRDPQDELTTAKVGDTVAGWSQVKSAGDATITHRWILDGKTVKDIPLQIKGSSGYRAWSKKTVAHPGNWKFQVVDSDGNVLKEVAFTAS